MRNDPFFPKSLLWGILAAMILAAGAAIVIKQAQNSREDLPVLATVPEFELLKSDSTTFNSSELRGKIFVLDFIFTSCPGACPVMSAKMSELYQYYAHSDKVQFISISVDPERDTLEVLREYAKKQGVTDDRWIFLRGPVEEVKRISEKGFYLAAENLPGGHSTKFVLIDEKGQIRAYYDALNVSIMGLLKTQLTALARKLI